MLFFVVVCRFCSLIGFTEEEVTSTVVMSGEFENVKKICRYSIFLCMFHLPLLPPLILTPFLSLPLRDIVEGPLAPSVAPLFLSVVQKLWVKMAKAPGDVTKDDMDFARMMASIAVSTCDHCEWVDGGREGGTEGDRGEREGREGEG